MTTAAGTVTVNGTTPVVVANPNVSANSVIVFGLKTKGGTPGALVRSDVTPGTSFTITGASGDTSTYNYLILG